MIDCGFTVKEAESRLEKQGFNSNDLTAILVTHEHADHIQGVAGLARRYNIPVYATSGTARSSKLTGLPDTLFRKVDLDRPFIINSLEILPVSVPHDAHEPCQFVISDGISKLGILTDLGSISLHVKKSFQDCKAMLLEANHDLDMLWRGHYPPSLKQRVASDWGHLSNLQARAFLDDCHFSKLTTLVLGHMSQQNNTLEIWQSLFGDLQPDLQRLEYATQENGFDWITV